VIVVDANVLIYAINEDAPDHRAARAWLDAAVVAGEAVGFAWIVILAFLRLTTSPGILGRPLTADAAIAAVRAWLGQPSAVVVEPNPRHLEVLQGLLAEVGTAGSRVPDAHLAAIALEHGASICSFDADFARFRGVRWVRPGD